MSGENVFYRKSECDSLLSFIERSEDGLNICIDGAWGIGKSRFCTEIDSRLKAKGEKTIYFDAFKHDLQENPLLALLGEFSQLHTNGDQKESFIRNVSKYCTPLVKSSLKAMLKRASFDLVDIKGYEDIISAAREGAESGLSLYIEDSIREYNKKDDSITMIRNLIINFMEEEGCKVVIIVDELDRCRPSYALEVIEKIKHVFDIKGVTFILSMCKEQLLASIEKIYGKSSQNESYLEKFIDFTLVLRSGKGRSESISQNYCKNLLSNRLTYIELSEDELKEVVFCLSDICFRQDLTLREVEKVVDSCLRVFLTFGRDEMPLRMQEWYCSLCVICGYLSWADSEQSHICMRAQSLTDIAVNHVNTSSYYKRRDGSVSSVNVTKDGLDKKEYLKFYSLVAFLNNNKKSDILSLNPIMQEHGKLKEHCELSSMRLNDIFSDCMARAIGVGEKQA